MPTRMGIASQVSSLKHTNFDCLCLAIQSTFDNSYIVIDSGNAVGVQHSSVQHLALGLLAQLMQKTSISTQVIIENVIIWCSALC